MNLMDNATVDQDIEEKSNMANINFRMVTFTLAGRDYAINIMKVKEISKDNKYTYVPNAAPFVIGVYNLRGDIISVIDLRVFFNQMTNTHNGDISEDLENMIILRLEEHTIAVVVDTIDKVVEIPSESIQPPHPLFGDINVKYISGVVESDKKLYVILDVESIFNSEESDLPEVNTAPISLAAVNQYAQEADNEDDLNLTFISESLATFKKMFVSSINMDWVKKRFKDWTQKRKASGKNVQFEDEKDAIKFMETFHSPYTGNFWGPDYIDCLKNILPEKLGSNYFVLNGGCGNGVEAYSVATIFKKEHPTVQLKILAYDNDLMNISSAPTLMIDKNMTPEYYWNYLSETLSGSWQFNETIKDSIIFEYHDIAHNVNLPALDLVIIRDLLSLLTPEVQLHVLSMIMDNLKPNGILIVGKNEKIDINMGFSEKVVNGLTIYIKK
jgi:chemotaxis signal transduction protein/chemotaxis methyl-accepting protein methylase